MPLYEYHCTECEHITDILCGFEQRPNSILCEECEAQANYGISAPAIRGGDTRKFHKHGGETIGDLFDQGGVELGSKANKAANMKRLKKMRDKKND